VEEKYEAARKRLPRICVPKLWAFRLGPDCSILVIRRPFLSAPVKFLPALRNVKLRIVPNNFVNFASKIFYHFGSNLVLLGKDHL